MESKLFQTPRRSNHEPENETKRVTGGPVQSVTDAVSDQHVDPQSAHGSFEDP